MSYELGRVHISQLLTQNSVIAEHVAVISLAELCTGTGAECNVIPAASAGMRNISAGMAGTPVLNGVMRTCSNVGNS